MTGGKVPARAGAHYERVVRDALHTAGLYNAERNYGAGRADDIGDIRLGAFSLQCKGGHALHLAADLDAAVRQAGDGIGILVQRRWGRGPRESYAVMRLEDWCELARRSGLT